MSAISFLLLGIVIGAAIGYLFARGRLAAFTADMTGRARAADERARAAEEKARMIERGAAERAALIDGQLGRTRESAHPARPSTLRRGPTRRRLAGPSRFGSDRQVMSVE